MNAIVIIPVFGHFILHHSGCILPHETSRVSAASCLARLQMHRCSKSAWERTVADERDSSRRRLGVKLRRQTRLPKAQAIKRDMSKRKSPLRWIRRWRNPKRSSSSPLMIDAEPLCGSTSARAESNTVDFNETRLWLRCRQFERYGKAKERKRRKPHEIKMRNKRRNRGKEIRA